MDFDMDDPVKLDTMLSSPNLPYSHNSVNPGRVYNTNLFCIFPHTTQMFNLENVLSKSESITVMEIRIRYENGSLSILWRTCFYINFYKTFLSVLKISKTFVFFIDKDSFS